MHSFSGIRTDLNGELFQAFPAVPSLDGRHERDVGIATKGIHNAVRPTEGSNEVTAHTSVSEYYLMASRSVSGRLSVVLFMLL